MYGCWGRKVAGAQITRTLVGSNHSFAGAPSISGTCIMTKFQAHDHVPEQAHLGDHVL